MMETEVLLQPTAEAPPCGEALDYDFDFLELEIVARGRSEQQMGESVSAGEEPDWPKVETMAVALCARSKDLRIALLLARGRLHNAGLAGFEEGLRLLAGYVERYWDTVHPVPEPDEDDTIRASVFAALSDTATVLNDVRRAPLVHSTLLGTVTLRDIQIAERRLAPGTDTRAISPIDIDAIFRSAAQQDLANTALAVAGCIRHLEAMTNALADRGDYGHYIGPLVAILREAHQEVSTRVVEQPAPDDPAAQQTDAPPDPATPESTPPMAGPGEIRGGEIRGRADVIASLERICRWYATNEPGSPVPVLLERAKRLVSQDFLALLLDLAPAGADQFRHLAGIKDNGP
jgi:type VI secretion system protein ImpA